MKGPVKGPGERPRKGSAPGRRLPLTAAVILVASAGLAGLALYGRYAEREAVGRTLTAEALATARRVLGGSEFTFLQLPDMGGEDFSYFARETPAFMFGLGVKPKEGPSSPVHSATFVADENAVALGVRLLATMVLDYSASHAGKSAGQKTR